MTGAFPRKLLVLVMLGTFADTARAADLVALSPQTWERYIPQGKEVDGIYGDFALTNDQLMAVVANPIHGRNANMTVRNVGGCLIDLTRRDRQSDQLSAYYPGAQLRDLKFAGIDVEAPTLYEVAELDRVFVKARRITLRLVAAPREKDPDVEVSYTLEDGWPYVLVTTTFSNRRERAVDAELVDAIRADHSFEFSPEAPAGLFWAYDKHFGQAYGVIADGHEVVSAKARSLLLRYRDGDGKVAVRLGPGETYRLSRRIVAGSNLFDVRRVADSLTDKKGRLVRMQVKDTAGRPIPDADVVMTENGKPYSWGRTNREGHISIDVGDPAGTLTVSALGRESKEITIARDVPEVACCRAPPGCLGRGPNHERRRRANSMQGPIHRPRWDQES